jgi:hypothetical protein
LAPINRRWERASNKTDATGTAAERRIYAAANPLNLCILPYKSGVPAETMQRILLQYQDVKQDRPGI